MSLSPYLVGLMTGLSLIVAIGAQNAFVLRHGLRGEHVLAVCLTCALSDAILIVMGFWRRTPSFLKHAYTANMVVMAAGFLLIGYQLTGYFVS